MSRPQATGAAVHPPSSGFSLIELVTAAAAGGLLLVLLASLLATQERLVAGTLSRIAAADAVRATAGIARAEVSPLLLESDVVALASTSLALRAFRGTAVSCGSAAGAILVRYRGLREPNADKDSVLVLAADGDMAARLTSSRRAGGAPPPGCAPVPGEELLAWELEGADGAGGEATANEAARAGVPIILFESGTYFLDGAFRYRRGLGGRQPLTEELLAPASSFAPLDGAVELRLSVRHRDGEDPRRSRPGLLDARARLASWNSESH